MGNKTLDLIGLMINIAIFLVILFGLFFNYLFFLENHPETMVSFGKGLGYLEDYSLFGLFFPSLYILSYCIVYLRKIESKTMNFLILFGMFFTGIFIFLIAVFRFFIFSSSFLTDIFSWIFLVSFLVILAIPFILVVFSIFYPFFELTKPNKK